MATRLLGTAFHRQPREPGVCSAQTQVSLFLFLENEHTSGAGISYSEGQVADPLSQDSMGRRDGNSCLPRPQSQPGLLIAAMIAGQNGGALGAGRATCPTSCGMGLRKLQLPS